MSRWDGGNEKAGKACAGRTVASVERHGERATVVFEDGARLHLSLDGDCCSHSYFTKEAQFEDLIGATVVGVEERGEPEGFKEYDLENTDHLSWHFLVFVTTKGHFTIDWRNDSNGYYDGSVDMSFRGPPLDDVAAAVWSDWCHDNGVPQLAPISRIRKERGQ